MADWLVLENFEGIIGSRSYRMKAGTISDDAQDPVTTLRANGAAMIPNLAAYAAATLAFNQTHDPQDPRQAQMSMIPVLQSYGFDVAADAGIAVVGTDLYVNAAYTGVSTGSETSPAKTLAAAAMLAGAGDRVHIMAGTYAEAFPQTAGVDWIGECAPRSGDVQITGQLTAAFAGTVNLVNLYITQDVAATATMLITGANATLINMYGCLVEAGAAADEAIDCDAVAAVIFPWNTAISSVTGNASDTVLMSAGDLLGEQCSINHADGITGPATAINCDGTGIVDVVVWDFQILGNVVSTTGAQNPTTTFRRGRIATGAQGAIATSSTGACVTQGVDLVSAEANGFAVTGVGVFTHSGLVLSGAAVDMSPALNAGTGALIDIGYATVQNSGSVTCVQIIQGGQPVAAETLTIGADIYEADGAGANFNFVIAGNAADTMANLLAEIVAQGTEPLFADLTAATVIRLRNADGAQGNILASGPPNIVLAEAMTNYVFDCGAVNMNTLGGEAQVQMRQAVQTITMNAGHAASGSCRFSFPFTVTRFQIYKRTAAGIDVVVGTDTALIQDGDVEVVLAGGGLVATDIVTVHGFE